MYATNSGSAVAIPSVIAVAIFEGAQQKEGEIAAFVSLVWSYLLEHVCDFCDYYCTVCFAPLCFVQYTSVCVTLFIVSLAARRVVTVVRRQFRGLALSVDNFARHSVSVVFTTTHRRRSS